MEKDEFYKEKFFVVKNDVIKEELDYLRQQDDAIYENILAFLRNISNANGEKEYLVVNQDEPYAQQVYDLIKENEKKKIVAFIGRAGSGKDFQCNILEKHGLRILENVPRNYEDLKKYLEEHYIEGIVFYRGNGEMCKIKRSDFGFNWNK